MSSVYCHGEITYDPVQYGGVILSSDYLDPFKYINIVVFNSDIPFK